VEYSAADQARAAVELEMLQEEEMIVRMLSDYSVLKAQAQLCR
jgi:hypothetical protein